MTGVRLLLAACILALMVGTVACGGPKGCSTAIPGSTGGTSGGTGGGSSPPAGSCVQTSTGGTAAVGIYLMVADAGGIQGEFADTSTKKMSITPNFGTVSVDTNVPGDWLVMPGQKFMYSAYTSTGEIFAWSVSGAGLLTALNPPKIQASFLQNDIDAGMQAMITNPAGTLLFVVDQTAASPAIHAYQIGTAGLLTGPTTTTLPSGFMPFNLAIDGQGKYLYVSNTTGGVGGISNAVMGYSIGGSGALTALPNNPIASPVRQMQGEATGKFMFGTSGGGLFEQVLYVAPIQSDGEISPATTPVLGVPVEVTVQPNSGGTLVYAVDFPTSGSNSGAVEGFTFDASTGTLKEMANSPFTKVLGAHGEFDPTGQFFLLSSSTSAAAVALYVFDTNAFPDLSTQMASTGWSPGAWAPEDSH